MSDKIRGDIPIETLMGYARTLTADLAPVVNQYWEAHQVAAAILAIMLGASINAAGQRGSDSESSRNATVEAANAMLADTGYRIVAMS